MGKAYFETLHTAAETPASKQENQFNPFVHRGSYMSAYVLLNLLNKLMKRDKIGGLTSFLSLFGNEFNKFNKTRA